MVYSLAYLTIEHVVIAQEKSNIYATHTKYF